LIGPATRLQKIRLCCRYCIADGVPKRSFLVALVVGTILNLINQGDALFAGRPLDLLKLALTYAVPYAVATYGAVSFRLRVDAARASIADSER
jgi:hypothetical protein